MNINMASVSCAKNSLEKLPCYNSNPDAIEAGLELTIAYALLETRYKIWNSIFWKCSSTALKRQTNERMYGLCFDAQTSILKAKSALKRFEQSKDWQILTDPEKYHWARALMILESMDDAMRKQFALELDIKQLKLPLQLTPVDRKSAS